MPKIIKIGQCFAELFKTIKVARFWHVVYTPQNAAAATNGKFSSNSNPQLPAGGRRLSRPRHMQPAFSTYVVLADLAALFICLITHKQQPAKNVQL